ncbi:MAG TPA: helicase-related protein [bacterium]|jgi:Fanconi anemia group M protein|nr:helicase-related protein [bacterium]HOG38643.1 helicase-related protein [bacterium]HQI03502.1 helicase-related protein [bacterium]
MSKKKIVDSHDQLDIFNDRTFEVVDNKHTKRTPEEDSQKKLIALIGYLGFSPEIVKEEWRDVFYLLDNGYIKNRSIEARPYALDIAYACIKSNSIVCLNTGLGKTYIELIISIHFLKYKNVRKKVLILSPSKPLCLQHRDKSREILPNHSAEVLIGDIPRNKREKIWQENKIIIATPQTIMSEINNGSVVGRPEDIQLVIFDEVHQMTGKYDYTKLVTLYRNSGQNMRILGFTASLDSDQSKLEELKKFFGVSDAGVISRTEKSPDVAPYVYEREVFRVIVERQACNFWEYLRRTIKDEFLSLLDSLKKKLTHVQSEKYNFLDLLECSLYKDQNGYINRINVKEFNKLMMALKSVREKNIDNPGWYLSMKDWGLIMLFNTCLVMIDMGIHELRCFLERKFYEKLKQKPSQSAFNSNSAIVKCRKAFCKENLWTHEVSSLKYDPKKSKYNWRLVYEDAKLQKLDSIVRRNLAKQIMVFVSYRDTVNKVVEYLRTSFPEKKVERFIGQSNKIKDAGMSQKNQEDILTKYRNGDVDILVSTSIGEQGLNFSSLDVVVFYEPITDIRRVIQRMGRTARFRNGAVYVLAYKGEEELFLNIAFSKHAKVQKITGFYEKNWGRF